MKKTEIFTAGMAVLAVAVIASTSQASVLIDNFSAGSFSLRANGTSATLTQPTLPSGNVIGNARVATLERSSGDFLTVSSNMNQHNGSGTPGTYIIEAQFMNAARATLFYGSSGPLNANMTVGRSNAFGIEFLRADVGASVVFNVTSNGEAATQTQSTTGPGALYFDFDAFTATTAGTVNYKDIDSIEVIVTGLNAGDYTIDLMQATINPNNPQPIPSPAAVWGGLALIGGAILRRRRK